MSESLAIDNVITAEAGTASGAKVCPQAATSRFASGLNLPLAGAVLLHLGFLVLMAMSVGEKPVQLPEVYPIRLYSAVEVAAFSSPAERPEPAAEPLRRLPPEEVQERPAALLPTAPVMEMAREIVVPVAAEIVPVGTEYAAVSFPAAPLGIPAQADRPSAGASGAAPPSGKEASGPVESASGGGAAAIHTVQDAMSVVLAQPLYRENPPPEYPPMARRRQLEGTVVLEVLVGADGRVAGLAVHDSSGHSLLDEAALKTVKGWRFEPGRRGGAVVAMPVLVPVRFGLR